MNRKKQGITAKYFNKLLYIMSGCLLAATIIAGIYFGISLEKTSKKVSKNKYIAINNGKKIEALAQLSTDYNTINTENYLMDSYIPDNKKVSAILSDLEQMASSKSLSFTAYKTVEEKSKSSGANTLGTEDMQLEKKGNYYIFPFQLELEGSFAGINSMLMDIEDSNRLMDVRAISYTKDSSEALLATDIIKATLTVNVYLIK